MDNLYAAALQWVNDVRAHRGGPALGELPMGRQCSPTDGPLGRATGFIVGLVRAVDPHTGDEVSLPRAVQQFVRAFDRDAYPNLKEQ